jgi:hypothetical protein
MGSLRSRRDQMRSVWGWAELTGSHAERRARHGRSPHTAALHHS